MINYVITPDLNSHVYLVKLTFIPQKSNHILKLPVWIPGSYMVREFSKNIVRITADQNGAQCHQINKNTWNLTNLNTGTEVSINYAVYAYEFGIRTAFLDFNRGYFNNTSLCLYVEGEQQTPHSITLNGLPAGWQVATGLTKTGVNQFQAQNYDELIDCPVELGDFTRLEFVVKERKHFFVLSGTIPECFDEKRFIADVSKICETQINLFGGIAPFNDYTFILYLGGEIYTGLEHRNSTLLLAPYYSLPVTHQTDINDDYLKLLGLISHEFFHTWNVKRIKPQVFNPYNLESENYTKLLWWFEGITSYYDDLILRRSGLIDNKRYLQLITDNINSVYKYAGVSEQTLTNGSLTSWIKYYRQDENSPNSLVSYYVKGALVGLSLDLLIRDKAKNKSLDDVMLGLYQKWQGDGKGIEEDEFPQLIKRYTGCDLTNEINHFIDTCDELPLEQFLAKFGVTVHTLLQQRQSDTGKIIDSKNALSKITKFDLGCKLVKEHLGYKISFVYNDSIAQQVGLAANDLIIAINDIKLTDFDKQIALFKKDSKLNLSVFRQERLLYITATLTQPSFKIRHLAIDDMQKLSVWLG